VDNAAPKESVVVGFERLEASGKASDAELGDVLIGELGCAHCHRRDTAAKRRMAPDLAGAGARLTPQYIRAFLQDPSSVRPGTTMPNMIHGGNASENRAAIEALTHYLVSLGGPIDVAGNASQKLTADHGKRLYHRVGCIACHEPAGTPKLEVSSVPMGCLSSKTTVAALTDFLLDPSKVRPSGRMPSMRLSRDEASAIAVYLLREQLGEAPGEPPVGSPGIGFEYYDGIAGGDVPDLAKAQPKATGTVERITHQLPVTIKDSNFTIVYRGAIRIDRGGRYTFFTRSDDASFLWIGTDLVVDNGGMHPPQEREGTVDLGEGLYPIRAILTQGGGGYELSVSWKGPSFDKRELSGSALSIPVEKRMVPLEHRPFSVNSKQAKLGQSLFSSLACNSCHAIGGQAVLAAGERASRAKPLAQLDPSSPASCLGPRGAKGQPRYSVSEPQRRALSAALSDKARLERPADSAQRVTRALAALNCYACHDRAGVGGMEAARVAYFETTPELGDEGRLPPSLSGSGDKLRPEALRRIIHQGELHVRPYMALRMPTFPEPAADGLVETLVQVDRRPSGKAPEFTVGSAKDGRTLVGTEGGLACITCHRLSGHDSFSLNVVDLTSVPQRLNPDWFERFVSNPQAFNSRTRMPPLWPGGVAAIDDIAGGNAERQQEAIWNYLTLGESMPLPAGLKVAGMMLTPTSEPIVFRTFINGASPRALAIGFPEKIHVAFDANVVRLAKAWKGRFFDAKNSWFGRGGGFADPAGVNVIDMPTGPALAYLPNPDAPWPEPQLRDRNVGGRFLGYRLDKARSPILMYQLKNTVIHEQPLPRLRQQGAELVRRFTIERAGPGLYLLAAEGSKVVQTGRGSYIVDDKVDVRVESDRPVEMRVRTSPGKQQLLLPIAWAAASVEVILSW
jgi:cytochrome c553